jgi:hypothetical protein
MFERQTQACRRPHDGLISPDFSYVGKPGPQAFQGSRILALYLIRKTQPPALSARNAPQSTENFRAQSPFPAGLRPRLLAGHACWLTQNMMSSTYCQILNAVKL